jgi:hypothetical protein
MATLGKKRGTMFYEEDKDVYERRLEKYACQFVLQLFDSLPDILTELMK